MPNSAGLDKLKLPIKSDCDSTKHPKLFSIENS